MNQRECDRQIAEELKPLRLWLVGLETLPPAEQLRQIRAKALELGNRLSDLLPEYRDG